MQMSRALEPLEPATGVITPAAPRARDVARPTSGVGPPLAPIFTAMAVMVLVVLAISFARSAGVVAALWGAGGLAVAVWLRTSRGTM